MNGLDIADEIIKKECCICNSKTNLELHHVIQSNKYDELYRSRDNLVVMCNDCHHKYHQKYNGDITFKTLLQFKETENKECKRLQKKHKGLLRSYNSFKESRAEKISNLESENQALKKRIDDLYENDKSLRKLASNMTLNWDGICVKRELFETVLKELEKLNGLYLSNPYTADDGNGYSRTIERELDYSKLIDELNKTSVDTSIQGCGK